MESILNVIKCVVCHEIIESPVILPCSCNICKKHVSDHSMDLIRCEICGVKHQIPTNGFQLNKALQVIIKTEIANLDFGSVHKEAKKSCESVKDSLKELKLILKDPYFYIHGKISELKNSVQLKGEELKLIIDQEMKKIIDKLEEYERESKEYLSSNEFKEESNMLESEIKIVQSNLDSWLEYLNK